MQELTHGQKISQALKGRKFSAESRAKMSAAKMGKPRSEETKAKIAAAHLGVPRDEATRKAISEGMKAAMKVKRELKAATQWKHPNNR
ncbi:Hypothetical protein NGAL_HAMBI490_60880 [Neorhizobium galegae bv. officinalis]|nr:Hypothetical protein NGAL_HAMBI490_60880 [Neorhizobium galegae bv. officinalis]